MQSIDNNIMSCLTMQSFAVVCSYDRCTMMHSRIRHSRSSGEMRDARCFKCHVPRRQRAKLRSKVPRVRNGSAGVMDRRKIQSATRVE